MKSFIEVLIISVIDFNRFLKTYLEELREAEKEKETGKKTE